MANTFIVFWCSLFGQRVKTDWTIKIVSVFACALICVCLKSIGAHVCMLNDVSICFCKENFGSMRERERERGRQEHSESEPNRFTTESKSLLIHCFMAIFTMYAGYNLFMEIIWSHNRTALSFSCFHSLRTTTHYAQNSIYTFNWAANIVFFTRVIWIP